MDVAQDVITREDDCGTDLGTWITREESDQIPEPFIERLIGRMAAIDIVDESSGAVLVERNAEIVPRSSHASTALAPGDRIEIVVAVGGG